MSISDGQKVNAANSNSAWVSKTSDDTKVGKLDLADTDPASGATINNVQRELNSEASFTGKATNAAENATPTYTSDAVGIANEDLQARAGALTVRVDSNTTAIVQNQSDISLNTQEIANVRTTQGTSGGDTDFGAFTGTVLTSNTTVKANVQELGTQVDTNVSDVTDLQNDKEDKANKGVANGYAPLDAGALVPAANLPSYVDDVLEFADLASFPVTGETGKIYVAIDTGFMYRWSGSIYIDITSKVDSVNSQVGAVVLDADDISDAATTNKYATQTQLDKVDFLTVTQAVDLDTLETDVTANNSKVSADGSINTHSDVDLVTTPPVLGDILEYDGSSFVPVVNSGGGGSGEGGINYILNSDAETDISGWSLYDDGAVSEPIDGNGGGGISSEISQLTDASNSGMTSGSGGVANTFSTIGAFDLKRIDLKLFSAGSGGTFDIHIYGVTGGAEPDPTNIIGSITGNDASAISVSATVETFNFVTPIALSAATQYAVVIDARNVTGNNLATRYDGANPYGGGLMYTTNDFSTWNQQSGGVADLYFNLFSQAAGGSIPITRTTTASEILVGDASFKASRPASDTQGNGFRYDFSIDPLYLGKNLNFNFSYKMLDFNYASADYKVFIYDVDNATLLGAISNDDDGEILNHTGDGTTMQGRFSATDSLNYRLLVHNTVATATATDMAFDKVSIGPDSFLLVKDTGVIGEIISSGSVDTPENFLYCDGAAISRSVYSDLFTAIGTSFGNGDGSTTFNKPDLRGLFLRGQDDGAGNDPDAAGRVVNNTGGNTGDNVGSEQVDLFGSHNHGGGSHTHNIPYQNPNVAGGNAVTGWQPNTGVIGNFVTAGPNSTVIATQGGNETRPKNVNVRYYIRYNTKDNILSRNETLFNSAVCRAYLASTQIIPTSTVTTILLDTISFDSTNSFNVSTGEYTAQSSGKYRVTGQISFSDNASANNIQSRIHVNGTIRCMTTDNFLASATNRINTNDILDLVKGDVVTLEGFQDSGGDSSAIQNDFATYLAIEKIQDFSVFAVPVEDFPALIEKDLAVFSGVEVVPNVTNQLFDPLSTSIDNVSGMGSDRYTFQRGGYFTVTGDITFSSSSTAFRIIYYSINGGALTRLISIPGNASTNTLLSFEKTILVSKGDYIQFTGRQGTGANETQTLTVKIEETEQRGNVLSTTETLFSTVKVDARRNTSTQTLTAGVFTKVIFNGTVTDDLNLFDTTLSRFTAPKTATYVVTSGLIFNGVASSQAVDVVLRVNGNALRWARHSTSDTVGGGSNDNWQLELSKNDYVEIWVSCPLALGILSSATLNGGSFLTVHELPDFSTFGYFGETEVIESAATAINFNATGASNDTWADLGTLPLTSGEWDIEIQAVYFSNGATTTTVVALGGSTISGNTSPIGLGVGYVTTEKNNTSQKTDSLFFHDRAVVTSGPTTYYAKGYAGASITNLQFSYKMSARKIK